MVPLHVVAERIVRGDIQQVAGGAGYVLPTRHKTAACGRRRRHSFNFRGNFVRVRKVKRGLRVRPRLVCCGSHFKRGCAWDTILP
jgi:hypothetical protein